MVHLIDNPDVLERWTDEEKDEALSELSDVVEELYQLARGDVSHGSSESNEQEADKLHERANAAFNTLGADV